MWRCPVCTFMSGPDLNACSKCKEPVTLEQKLAYSIDRERALRAGGVTKLPPAAPTSPVAVRAAAAVIAKPSAPAGLPPPPPKPRVQPSALPPPPPREKSAYSGSGGGGGRGMENKISKANIHGTVQSRLNHDTASYRGKFESDAPPGPPQKGANVQTLKSMTKNGFVSSATRNRDVMAAKAVSKPHEAPPVKFRAKYEAGGGTAVGAASSSSAAAAASAPKYHNPIEEKPLNKKWANESSASGGIGKSRGLIDMLQEACSGAAQASLKHAGPTHKPEYKPMDGFQTAYQL